MSKDLFHLMREKEIVTSNFLPTKKEIKTNSIKLAQDILDSGNFNIEEVYSQTIRLKDAISEIEKVLKSSLPEQSFEAFGITGTFRNGGNIKNYEDDPVYLDLKKQLENRKELLDAALKTDLEFYDSDGVQVPKVSTTIRKSSLAISY